MTKGAVNTYVLQKCDKLLSLRFSSRHIIPLPGPLFRTYGATKAAPSYLYYVSDLFTVFLRLLFNIPSRYYFTIGFVLYLDLEVNALHIHA